MVDIPAPFRAEKFKLSRKGISEDLKIKVFINSPKDFAYLDPLPELDYRNYIPRVTKFGLNDYKRGLQLHERRYDKIEHHLANERQSLLEMVKEVMSAHSTLIIEVPSLFDPLISIYNCDAYSEFYFSRQHPYVFSPPSLQRLMESSYTTALENNGKTDTVMWIGRKAAK